MGADKKCVFVFGEGGEKEISHGGRGPIVFTDSSSQDHSQETANSWHCKSLPVCQGPSVLPGLNVRD